MDEKLLDSNIPEETEKIAEDTAILSEEEDNSVIITVDDDDSGVDADELEKAVFEKISARESHIEEYIPPKLGPLKWIENFVYRNKTLIIIAIGAILSLTYIIVTSLPAKHDLRLSLYVSYSDFTSSVQPYLENELVNYCDDWDGDEKISVLTRKFDISIDNGFAAAAYYGIVQDHLNGKPESMLWVVDEGLYKMMIDGYGEEIFESYKGAPLWIEITWNEKLNDCISSNQSPRFGFCLLRMTDEFRENKELCKSYDTALQFLEKLSAARPEILNPEQ